MAHTDEPARDTALPSLNIDTTKPSIARAYDAVLGGKDNYEADRQVRDQLLAVAPELGTLAWDNRGFLVRATQFLAGPAGVQQFLDCGCGLPTVDNTHEAAQRANPHAAVVYVDNDPIVLAHGRALLEQNRRTRFVDANFTDPDTVLTEATATGGVDFTRPVAVHHIGTMHHISDDGRPHDLVARFVEAMPSGSYLTLSHFYNPDTENPELAELATRLETAFLSSPMGCGRFRTRTEIAAFCDGLELVDPGLVTLADWRPTGHRTTRRDPVQDLMLGAVARKP